MSDAGNAVATKPEPKATVPDSTQRRVTELRVTGHLMTLETGVFCVFQAPGSALGLDETGLPGVRISLPPGPAGNPDAVSISTFRADGWLSGRDPAALVRVSDGPAQVLVTVYQSTSQGADAAPRLQVLRLSQDPAVAAAARGNGAASAAVAVGGEPVSVIAHVQRTGDVGAKFGDWLGERGSKQWIEGFAVLPPNGIAAAEIEYQAVLGRGWNSPWMEGGKFCGSRGMALPLLGLRVRLKGNAAKTHTLSYAASFVDGTEVGPVNAGEACEAASLAALEAFQVLVEPRAGARQSAPGRPAVELPNILAAKSPTTATPPAAVPPAPKRKPAPTPTPVAATSAAEARPSVKSRPAGPAGRRAR